MGRGQLVFKGEEPKKKKKNSKHAVESSVIVGESQAPPESNREEQGRKADEGAATSTILPLSAPKTTASAPSIQSGTGKVTTSGTVVTGYGTQFTRQINVGDAFLGLIQGRQEMRVVTMRLSDTSINLSSAFSSDLKHPTEFMYISKPKSTAPSAPSGPTQLKPEEQAAFGTFSSHKELIYHEKTEHGSYRIKKQKLDGDVTRSDLLSMRAKKKSDKYC